jgi:vancomycin resistance protein YoaR
MNKKLAFFFEKLKNFFKSKKVKMTGIILAIFLFVIMLSFSIYTLSFNDRIFPNIYVGKTNYGGLTKVEAKNKLTSGVESVKNNDLEVSYNDKKWQISPQDLEINYDLDRSLSGLFLIGRSGNFWQRIKNQVSVLFKSKKYYATFNYNNVKQDEFFNKISNDININSKDAEFTLAGDDIKINAEKDGREANINKLGNDFNSEFGYFFDRRIILEVNNIYPKITASGLANIQAKYLNVIGSIIVLKSDKGNVDISKNQIANWVDIVADFTNKSAQLELINKVYASPDSFTPLIIFNTEKIKIDIGNMAKTVNQEPVDAKLTISNGKASVFTASQNGYQLNQEKTLELILKNLNSRLNSGQNSADITQNNKIEITLPIETKKPTVTSDTIDNLGIEELIGKGTTNFKGSPVNRITNIKVGSSIFNGVLVKPGETFSTLKTLGEISTEKGFLPELVIKEDGTKPEVGGGLCQVSTTLFRAVLNSGLEVTERTNHKYRVSYYEPPVGMDATIYDPAPDFKFVNNTSGYILIQTYIKGTELTFEMYGTKDGRAIEISDPVTYDVTSPAEPIYKEDSSVPSGEVIQKEKAHNGSKASFHYKVTKDGQILFEKTFVSSYVPWRAVYLVAPGELPGGNQDQNQEQSSTPTESPSPSPESSPTPTPEPSPSPST